MIKKYKKLIITVTILIIITFIILIPYITANFLLASLNYPGISDAKYNFEISSPMEVPHPDNTMTFYTTDSAEKIFSYYKKQLVPLGWKQTDSFYHEKSSGFVMSDTSFKNSLFPTYTISILKNESGYGYTNRVIIDILYLNF